ncbi:MAG TPA: hypothetical protein VF148_03540 [Acidimicrobiia bacterium]
MVAPEGTGSDRDRPATGRGVLFVGAALVMVIGFVVLGAVSSSDRVAVVATTTTSTTLSEPAPPVDPEHFSVSQIVTGEPLQWTMAGEFDGYPIGLTEHGDNFYLFTTQIDSRGLTAWRSSDGLDWVPLGRVIGDEYLISTVVSTPHGLVAGGQRRYEPGLVIWTSEDGTQWSMDEIPSDSENPYLMQTATAIAGTEDGTLLIAVTTDLDTPRLIEDRLGDAGIEIDMRRATWRVQWAGEQGHVLQLDGPLGLDVTEISLDDLDLTLEEREWVANGFDRAPRTDIWVKYPGASWQPSAIEGAHTIYSIVKRPKGDFLAFGDGAIGPIAQASRDGLDWTSATDDSVPIAVSRWDDYLAGLAVTVRPDVLVSDDGRTWEALGLGEHFPLPISWAATTLGAGDSGLALAVEGLQSAVPTGQIELPVLRTGTDAILTLDFEEGAFVLDTETTTLTWDMALPDETGVNQPGIEVNPGEQSVRFSDPASGELLAEVPVAALQHAQAEYFADRFLRNMHRAFVFTANGIDWTIQDVAYEIGSGVVIAELEVAEGRVLAIVVESETTGLVGPSTAQRIGTPFHIWTAEIP